MEEEDELIKLFKLWKDKTETAKLCYEMDWSKTSLGPISTWPETLKCMVGVLTASKMPMYLLWGV